MKELSNFDFVARRESEEKRKALHRCCGNSMRSIFDTGDEWAVIEKACFCVEDAVRVLQSRNCSWEN